MSKRNQQQQQQQQQQELERGQLRSGRRFAKRVRDYTTEKELLKHHKNLINQPIYRHSSEAKLANLKYGTLICTTIRVSVTTNPNIVDEYLYDHFFEQFRLHTESPNSGFEVCLTFNCITKNLVR